MKALKTRLDALLVERDFFSTREKAKRAIMAGIVYSETTRLDKPGVKVMADLPITIKGADMPYVGRGGYKLEKALSYFKINLTDRIMLDVGASTGGFTDCALINGIKLSYALDVGYNQLAWKLRNDARVVVMERTNFRYANKDMFTLGRPDFATVDVSFISLKLIIPPLSDILTETGEAIVLIKPQFEAGKEHVGKKGIVKDKKVHTDVLEKTMTVFSDAGFLLLDLTYSPITGSHGNIEFLAHIKKANNKNELDFLNTRIVTVVNEAHDQLL